MIFLFFCFVRNKAHIIKLKHCKKEKCMKYIYIIVLLPGIAHLKTNMTTRKCFVLWLESLTKKITLYRNMCNL